MAGMTKSQAEIAGEIDLACARIIVLKREGNDEGAAEIKRETETLISGIKGAGAVAIKKGLRDQVRGAMMTKPVDAAELVPMTDWLNDLVEDGANEVRHLADLNMKGGQVLANIMLEVRRRNLLEDGTPDLMATLQTSKDASREIYERVTKDLPADSDIVRQVKRIKREAQNTMADTRVRYAKALDQAPADDASEEEKAAHAAEVAMYANIKREEGQSLAEAVAAHYGFKLMTRSEITMAAKKAKELEADSQAEEGDSDEGGASGVSGGGEDSRTPAKVFTDVADLMGRQIVVLGSVDLDEAFAELDKDARKAALGFLAQAVETFTALLNEAKAASEVEDEVEETDPNEAPAEQA